MYFLFRYYKQTYKTEQPAVVIIHSWVLFLSISVCPTVCLSIYLYNWIIDKQANRAPKHSSLLGYSTAIRGQFKRYQSTIPRPVWEISSCTVVVVEKQQQIKVLESLRTRPSVHMPTTWTAATSSTPQYIQLASRWGKSFNQAIFHFITAHIL